MDPIRFYYEFLFLFSLAMSGVYAYMWNKHFDVAVTLIFVLIPIVNLGYLWRFIAETLNDYVRGTQIIYLGGCFLILFITLYIFSLCDFMMPLWARTGMILICVAVYILTLTIGKSTVFYKKITAVREGSHLYVHKVYGPGHTVFYLMLAAFFGLGLAVIIYSYLKKTQISRRIITLLFIPELFSGIAFSIRNHLFSRIELTPAAYCFAQVMYICIAYYIVTYSIEETAVDSLMEKGTTGFISFDFRLNYLGSSSAARDIFPELMLLVVDRPLSRQPRLDALFRPWLLEHRENPGAEAHTYSEKGKIWKIEINDLCHSRRSWGYQMVITDDTANQKYIEMLSNYNTDLEREVERKTADVVRVNNQLLRSMAMLVESRDNSTGGHIIRTSDVVEILLGEITKEEAFAKSHGITEKFALDLIKAAPLHDIGKIAVDDEVLKKPGRFTPEEFEKMKQHAPEGAKVLHRALEETDDVSFKRIAENAAHYHHERMDGSGYPEGLKGEEIPMEARIMAIADVYDALVSKRVYKERMSFEKADEIMKESMGKHFDPALAPFYERARPKIEAYYLAQDP